MLLGWRLYYVLKYLFKELLEEDHLGYKEDEK
jgi:hypothetical protein